MLAGVCGAEMMTGGMGAPSSSVSQPNSSGVYILAMMLYAPRGGRNAYTTG